MALSFIHDKPLVGVGIGAGAAGLGLVFGYQIAPKIPVQAVQDFAAKHPWAVGAGLSAAAFGGLWYLKKKQAAWGSLAGSLATLALPVYQSEFAGPAALAPASGATSGFGVAVAESRGFGAPPSIDVFSEAPSNISLLGNANNPDASMMPAASNPSVFGGASF